MFGYVYKTTSLLDNRIYIGQKRGKFTSKYLGSGKHLELAVKKYGEHNFICELIHTSDNQQELDSLEKFYISEARKILTVDELFNIADGGLNGINGSLIKRRGLSRPMSLNPNWRGGVSTPKCCDCGKNISYDCKRCKSCTGKLRNKDFSAMAKKRGAPWNKGLTKATNSQVAHMASTKVGKPAWNKGIKAFKQPA